VIDLIRETCREEKVSLVLVTHTPQVAEQFERVENLEEINRLSASGNVEGSTQRVPAKAEVQR